MGNGKDGVRVDLKALAGALPPIRRLREARDTLLAERAALARALARAADEKAALVAELAGWRDREVSRFYHYNAVFDPEALIRSLAAPDPAPRDGCLVNFLGVAVDPLIAPHILGGRGGQVEPLPIPANWHADIAEWGAVLRAVELAGSAFTVVELGCGWGCWLNNAGVAARRSGRRTRLIGIEGDPGHLAFAREATARNGFAAADVTLHHGIAAADGGTALFPRQDRAGESWSLAPRFGVAPEEVREACESGAWDAIPMRPLAALVPEGVRVDLLHVDIQGGEADLVAGSLSFLAANVAFLVVGTHGRAIEGRLVETLAGAGWVLEIDRPAFLARLDLLGAATVDGLQGWRNPHLLPAEHAPDPYPSPTASRV